MRNSIQHLSLKTSVLSLSLLFLAYPAQSQESSASLIEEIIVTSQTGDGHSESTGGDNTGRVQVEKNCGGEDNMTKKLTVNLNLNLRV